MRNFYHQFKWSLLAGANIPYFLKNVTKKEIIEPLPALLPVIISFLIIHIITEILFSGTGKRFPKQDDLLFNTKKAVDRYGRWKSALDFWTSFKMAMALEFLIPELILPLVLYLVYPLITGSKDLSFISNIYYSLGPIFWIPVTIVIILLYKFVFLKGKVPFDGIG